jgi:hypothetical protein
VYRHTENRALGGRQDVTGWAKDTARMGEMRNEYKIVVGKPERKTPLGRPRCRWDYTGYGV